MSQEEAGEIQTTRKRWRNVDEEEAEISGREKRQRNLNDDEEEEVSELPDSYQRPPSVNLDMNGENNTPIPVSLRTEGQISIDQGLIQQLVNTLQGISSIQYQQPPTIPAASTTPVYAANASNEVSQDNVSGRMGVDSQGLVKQPFPYP